MAFKSWQGSRAYRPSDGDTLAVIADREAAAGNPITAEDIARFNWGTEDPEEIQTLMRDELGARARDGDKGFVLSGDDAPRSELRIPEAFEQRGFSLEQTHQIRVASKDCPEQFLDCCSLPAITFDFDSSFVKPDVAEHLSAVEALIRDHADSRILVFGHTDAVGDEMYNKKLSERRAWAVHAFILNDPDAWETLYNHPDEEWGLAVVQEILADLGHDPGAIHGDWGPATRAAMRSFLGLDGDAPVKNDAGFRRELFAAYMGGKHDIEIERDRFLDPGFMGCGEFNLQEADETTNARNRRVTIYAFHKDRPPNLPCAFADTAPCKRQFLDLEHRHKPGFACSFYDSLSCSCPGEGTRCIEVYLLDTDGHAIPNCPFRARNGESVIVEGTADGEGLATLPDSVPPVIEIDWGAPTGHDGEAGSYRFSRPYYVDVPASGTQRGCGMRLENLGFAHSDTEVARTMFEAAFKIGGGAPFPSFADDVHTWHNSGDPSHLAGQDGDFGEDADPLDEPLPEDDDEDCSCLDDPDD